MGARCRLPWAALALVSTLTAGCCSPCFDSNDSCVVEKGSADCLPMAHCCDHCACQQTTSQVDEPHSLALGDEFASNGAPHESENCPPQEVCPPQICPPAVARPKHVRKHAARRKHPPREQQVEPVLLIGPESQFVPVPTRPVFGPRLNPRAPDEMAPGLLPPDAAPQIMPAPGSMPGPMSMPAPMPTPGAMPAPGPGLMPAPAPSDTLPKPGTSSTTSKKQPAKNVDLTSSLKILK